MKRVVVAVTTALFVNVLAALFVSPYDALLISLGRRFSSANDIADIPRLLVIGFLLTSVGTVAIGVLVERVTRSTTLRRTGGA